MLSIKGISKRYEELQVLENFSLNVPTNSFCVITGPSGCGKSTFFDILMGNVPRDKGTISWKENNIKDLSPSAAYMQQKDLLLPWLSLFQNAILPAMFNSELSFDPARKCIKLFDYMGISGFEDYLPENVSGGMKKRCALVRTLMFDREIILLDEPLSSLDAIRRHNLYSLLLDLQYKFRKTILMITHDIEEALLVADELIVVTDIPMRKMESFSLTSSKPRDISDKELLKIKSHVLTELNGAAKR